MARTRNRKMSRWIIALPAGIGGAVFGAMFGAAAAGFAGRMGGSAPDDLVLWTALSMGIVALLARAWLVEGAGDLARRVFMGAEQGTVPEYSAAQALEVRGRFEAALEAYEAGALEYPEDPEPLLRGARVLAAELDRPDDALAWLRRAAAIPALQPRQRITVDRELVELYDGPLGRPREALPILARLAEEHAGTQPGEWAGRRLAHLRTQLWQDIKGEDADDELAADHRQNRRPIDAEPR